MIQQIIDKGCGSRPAEEVYEIEQLTTDLKRLSLTTRDLDRAQNVIDSLEYSQRPLRHGTISEAHEETFEWALRAPAVVRDDLEAPNRNTQVDQGRLYRWLQAESGIFWISGKPGSGKSTFLKFVADHERTKKLLGDWAQPRDIILASHYFWSTGTIMQRSQQGLWQSLLLGLIRQLPHLISQICPEQWSRVVEHGTRYPSRHNWTSAELRECLKRVADLDPNKLTARVCLFIDGLDEFDGDHLDMMGILLNLSRSPILKLCVSSRPWNVFETSLGQSPKICMHELTHDDILNYTRNRLATHPRWNLAVDGDAAQGELLIESVTQRTQGVFLWVFLITKLLREGLSNEDTFEELEAFMNSVPPDLEEFFKRILDGVTHVYHHKMAGFLQIAASAEEPLDFLIYHFHENEYRDVNYSVKAPVGYLKVDEVDRIRSRTRKRLNSLTQGLLEIDQDGTVQFIHRTVGDWLMTPPMRAYLKSKSVVGFNEPLALLRAQLAWYKRPNENFPSGNLWGLAESVAFSAGVLYESNDPPLTAAAKSVLDGFVAATMQFWKRQSVSQGRGDSEDELVNNLRLIWLLAKADLWDYIWHKLDEMPDFLRGVIKSPGAVELEQCRGAIKDDGKSLRTQIATDLLGLLIYKLTGGHLMESARRQRRLGYDIPSNHRNKMLQVISGLICNLGADPDTLVLVTFEPESGVPAWIHIFLCPFTTDTEDIDQDTRQCMKEAMETLLDSLDRDYYKLREPVPGGDTTTVWDALCDHVWTLGCLRGKEVNTAKVVAPQVEFQASTLATCITKLSGTRWEFPWDRLRTAIEHTFQGEALELLLSTMKEHSVPWKKEMWDAQWKKRKHQPETVDSSRKRIKNLDP